MSRHNFKMFSSIICILLMFTPGCQAKDTISGTATFLSENSITVVTPQPTGSPVPSATLLPTLTQIPTSSFIPTNTPTIPTTPTVSPTPLFIFDLSGYDPDLFQPIDISHNPPLIARSDEIVTLVFDLVNTIYCPEPISICRLDPVLFFTYGDDRTFQSVPLNNEVINEMQSLVARLPASDQDGGNLRYYAEFSVPEAGYSLRYPVDGTIDLFESTNFVLVELPDEKPVESGEIVYHFWWGFGPDKVRSTTYNDYPTRVGSQAIDVTADGRIALLDSVNNRIIVYNPDQESYSSFPLPFTYKYFGREDLQFDQSGRVTVFDLFGEQVEGTAYSIPHYYRLLENGNLESSGPVYAKYPLKITKDLLVLDQYDSRLVAPFGSKGDANLRESQRAKKTWDFPYRFVEGLDPYVVHFADVMEDLAFEVHSGSPLGWIMDFERIPQGYLMLFGGYEQIRAVWINPSGTILKDISVPNGHYSELSPDGQVAVRQDGSLYVMSSTERGIEVHFISTP